MNIDLSEISVFDEMNIDIDKKVCFIFGNNGTGKSTFANHLEIILKEYDVRVFQGFDSVVNDNEELNAVILGEKNVEIDKKIREIDDEINKINLNKIDRAKLIDESCQDEDSLYKKMIDAKNKYKNMKTEIDSFYSREASRIKNLDPKIANTNYNKNNFRQEIDCANSLSDEEIVQLEKVLVSEEKVAPEINFPEIDAREMLIKVNELLTKSVKESVKISRLDNDYKKSSFAKEGLEIHRRGDICSFCGNYISDQCFDELEKYFSGEDIKKFEKELQDEVSLLKSVKYKIEEVDLSINYFYESFHNEFRELESDFIKLKSKIIRFIETLIISISEKQKSLFNENNELNITPPEDFKSIRDMYFKLIQKNNNNDLINDKSKAKDKLRFNVIKNSLREFDYHEKTNQLSELKMDYENSKENFDKVVSEIDRLSSDIEILKEKKSELKSKSKNEEKLATEINKLLDSYVNFKLVHYKHDQEGFYRVESKYTNEVRDVKQLSMGEKNIIAFLYFLKKLEEVSDEELMSKKIIVFDDPMTSNDNTMQYVMIEELSKLINKIVKEDKIKKLIIMTHNHHFYLNLTRYLGRNRYKNYDFLRFINNGINTNIKYINNMNEDFKSNYEALWQDFEFVYNSDKGRADLLCNIARRIVDTYTNFNSISKNDFYRNTIGAKKLFDVNSHEIEDLDADLTGVNKKTILRILYDCFKKNNGLNHFEKYFNLNIDDIKED